MALKLQDAIVEWASVRPSPFTETAIELGCIDGYLTPSHIAELLEAAVDDDELQCEEMINTLAVGKALGKLFTRQEQGESWLGILRRVRDGCSQWRVVPADRPTRDARAEAASALGAQLAATLHEYCHQNTSPRKASSAAARGGSTAAEQSASQAATAALRRIKGSLTSIAELVRAIAAASVPLANSQLGLPLLLTAALDEIGAAQFELEVQMGVRHAPAE